MSEFDAIYKHIINEYGDDTEKLKKDTEKARKQLGAAKVNRAKALDTDDTADDDTAEDVETAAEAETAGAEEAEVTAKLKNVQDKAKQLRDRMKR